MRHTISISAHSVPRATISSLTLRVPTAILAAFAATLILVAADIGFGLSTQAPTAQQFISLLN